MYPCAGIYLGGSSDSTLADLQSNGFFLAQYSPAVLNPCRYPTASPAALLFPSELIGDSTHLTVQLLNGGKVALNIDLNNVSIGGDSADFSSMNVDCPATLVAGATCSIQVTFQPIAGSADLRTAALNVPVDSTGISLSIPLSGNAIQSGPVATSTTVTSSLNPSVYNQSVTFTASVSSPGGTPAGSVTFSDGATALGTFALSNGTAVLNYSSLAVGPHSIIASYRGDSNFQPSTSNLLAQNLNQATSTTTLLSSLNPSYVTQSVIFTAMVASQYGGSATGNVTFKQSPSSMERTRLPPYRQPAAWPLMPRPR